MYLGLSFKTLTSSEYGLFGMSFFFFSPLTIILCKKTAACCTLAMLLPPQKLFQRLLRVPGIQFRIPSLSHVRVAQNSVSEMRLAELDAMSIETLGLPGRSTYTRVERRKEFAGNIYCSLSRVVGNWHALDNVSGSLLELVQGQV